MLQIGAKAMNTSVMISEFSLTTYLGSQVTTGSLLLRSLLYLGISYISST